MPRVVKRWRAVGAAVLAAAALGPLSNGRGGQGQKPAPANLKRLYFGISDCADCHTEGKKGKSAEAVLCKCDEQAIWEKDDKHKKAYLVLTQDRAQAMGKLLGYPADTKQWQACIVCHGVWAPDKNLQADSFKLEDGVSCVACHGAYENWYDPHFSPRNRKRWRSLSRQAKEEEYGLTDLWDPAKRTLVCASCHVGNSAEGKVVTHEMYAAGHPPLPSFEIATFSDAMPRHWEYLREKYARIKDEAIRKALGYDPQKLELAELVTVGGAMAFREDLGLTAGEAAKKDGGQDFALFDCAACHHDLKRPSWRQERGYAGSPGRPQPPTWPLALLHVGVRHASANAAAAVQGRQQLHAALAKLHRAYDAQPFGDSGKVAAAAAALVQWSDKLRADLGKASYDRTAALRLLRSIADEAADGTPDFESARQLAWGFQKVYEDYTRDGKPDPGVDKILGGLKKSLNLQLPSGQDREILPVLRVSLERQAAYDPDQVKKAFAQLTKLLPAK